jgi:hypothetical protein
MHISALDIEARFNDGMNLESLIEMIERDYGLSAFPVYCGDLGQRSLKRFTQDGNLKYQYSVITKCWTNGAMSVPNHRLLFSLVEE